MKMVQAHRIPTLATVILLLLLQPAFEAKKSKRKVLCPIGFQVAYSNIKGEPYCYRLKGPEKLADKYVGCSGNLYTSKLYNSLNLTKSELVLWTEYKSLYPGGPFIDYSYTKTTGSLLESTFEVDNPQKGIEEELCVVIDPVNNYTTTRCDEQFYRYCLVEPYGDAESMSTDGCEDFKGSWRFWAPKATCLSPATAVGGGAVRATWFQSKEICEKRGGTVLYNGWRYSNNPLLHISGSFPVYPLGITYDPQRHSQIVNENATTPPAEWGLDANIETNGNETSYGVIRNGIWDLVNSSYVFFDVICEKNIELRKVDLIVSADEQNKLILTVSDNVAEDNIYCFTDSETFHPTPVKISQDDIHNKLFSYVLKPIGDGYYWCVHIDSMNFLVSESNKALWVREEQSLRYNFAVKLALTKEYTFDNIERLKKIWEKKLKEYIFYSTNYYKINGGLEQIQDPKAFEAILTDFKISHPDLNPKEKDIFYGMKFKKLFLDGKTVILHLQLNPRMQPVQPGTWDGIEIVYMKPVYFCLADNHEFVESITVSCQIHSCVGNFNDGVQVVTTIDEGCIMSTELPALYNHQVTVQMPTPGIIPSGNPVDKLKFDDKSSDSSEEGTTTPDNTALTTTTNSSLSSSHYSKPTSWFPPTNAPVTTVEYINVTETVKTETPTITTPVMTTDVPTTRPPPAPEEQLQQVMDDLESLINNDSVPVLIEDISTAFDQVDELLAENVDLNIPGELLHLLDGIGSRLDLDGSENATTVRDNIALLVTNAQPDQPVKGLKIAAREKDVFTDDAFEIIREDYTTAQLQAEDNEAVVLLPESVSTTSRRISFVAFRNDRAFHSSSDEFPVNSRVLSVNVENLTQFDDGEYVDIHFTSLSGDPDRNQSRACAFWHFLDNGKGYWSQDGCTFIRATRPGMLDTCRCDHLTHFAEILVPRTVFSEENEKALEIITIVGCCLSMFGLIMIGVTAALFRSWRRDFSNKIWLQLCVSIFILIVCFLVIIFVKFDSYDIPCMLVGVLLHYSVLASFCWMLVAAVISYRRLVLVFTREASHKLLRAAAFAWGAPCGVVGVLLSAAPHSYARRFGELTPTGAFCYPAGLGLWLAVYAPIAAMLLANWTLFALIVRSVFASRRIQRHGDSNEALRCASVSCLLVFLFGLPWVFGLFAFNIVLAYLFAFTATFQGFVLFIFFVVGNKKTRDLWLNKLKIKQTRKIPVTSSTYTNRSTGPGWRGAAQTSVEAKVSKPRSLASPDDSRFS
uniref:G-protein coupled receptors family 2 profile 2 domain-containing protein n=1 Tax=Heliothis virescens TaxID=7102 RepID=A0A2A4JGD6_HELVI